MRILYQSQIPKIITGSGLIILAIALFVVGKLIGWPWLSSGIDASQAATDSPVKTSVQQSWIKGYHTSIFEVLAKHDIAQLDDQDIDATYLNHIKALKPGIILIPFWSSERAWNQDVIKGFSAKGFDGVYIDLWNDLSEDECNGRAQTLRQTWWSDGIHLVNAAVPFDYSYDLNGYMYEDYPVYGFGYTMEETVLGGYDNWIQNSPYQPYVIMNQRSTDDQDPWFWKRMRYATALSLLRDDMYVMYNYGAGGAPHMASSWWFDEWDLGLGGPTNDAYSLPNGVYAREFQNGIILVNGSGRNQTVNASDLNGTYYRFQGGQQPNWNNGQIFSGQITLSGASWGPTTGLQPIGDAIFLVNSPQTVVTDIILDDEYPSDRFLHDNIQGGFDHSGLDYNFDCGADIAEECPGDPPYFPDSWHVYPDDSAHYSYSGGSARWTPNIGVAGEYQVYEWHPTMSGANVIYTVHHAQGADPVGVNQATNGGRWNLLGTYNFNAGTNGRIEISSSGSMVVDAIKLVFQGGSTNQPNVKLTKSANLSQASPGQEIIYTIHYHNNSSIQAQNVIIKDNIPFNTTYLSSNPPAQSINNQLIWNLGALAPNQQGDLELEVRVN